MLLTNGLILSFSIWLDPEPFYGKFLRNSICIKAS